MRYLLLLAIAFTFAACGTSREKWANQHCSEAGGYEMGQKDARAKRSFNTEALQKKCPGDRVDLARKGYLDGFKAAGGKEPAPGEYEYGSDIFRDVVHAINKPGKKKTEEVKKADEAKKTEETPAKTEETTKK